MKPMRSQAAAPLAAAADHAVGYRDRVRPVHPATDLASLRKAFTGPLPEQGQDDLSVIAELIAAAEPGLVDNTSPHFHAWVMGGSSPVGVAADWLTSVWGQNAALYQTSPAAAVAEEAVEAWVLELLDLPRDGSVGLVTGATMASFVGLAAARRSVLARHGHDLDAEGLQGAPLIRIFLSDDVHVANIAALRHLGFGARNLVRIASDDAGLMRVDRLSAALAACDGPKIIVGQAGHINSGQFEDAMALADLASAHDAWLHIDGAFGLWARACKDMAQVTQGLERADSWSVDGHKLLQMPYDCGFAILRDRSAHIAAMSSTAGYLSEWPRDGRNPNNFGPELSRRARGFAAWAVLRSLGREGVVRLVHRTCAAARAVAAHAAELEGVSVAGGVVFNQVALVAADDPDGLRIERLEQALNARGRVFVRSAAWRGRRILRLPIVSALTSAAAVDLLCAELSAAHAEVWGSGPG